jgi:hypothetical protein
MRNISKDPANTVIGIVRDRAAAVKRAVDDFGERPNVHFIEAQVTQHASLKVRETPTQKLYSCTCHFCSAF